MREFGCKNDMDICTYTDTARAHHCGDAQSLSLLVGYSRSMNVLVSQQIYNALTCFSVLSDLQRGQVLPLISKSNID